MSTASTVGLPYDNITILNFETPITPIVSDTTFNFVFLDQRPILSGNYLASLYIEIFQEGNDTELGTITTQLFGQGLTNSFPVTSNYIGTGIIEMNGIPLKIQNTQVITIAGPINIGLAGNILFQETPPTASGILLLKPI